MITFCFGTGSAGSWPPSPIEEGKEDMNRRFNLMGMGMDASRLSVTRAGQAVFVLREEGG